MIPKYLKNKIYKIQILPYRLKTAMHYYHGSFKRIFHWLLYSSEMANFMYDITDLNKKYLIHFISLATKVNSESIKRYFNELENNNNLKTYLNEKILSEGILNTQATVHFGRRLGWYALVRAVKPKIVIETGVDKGLGSCVIALALIQNAKEGHKGFYYGTDILSSAGELFKYPYNKFGKILYGDSIQSLKKLNVKIDLFINDSDHSTEYERHEYLAIKNKLRKNSIIIGDNSHSTDELSKFAHNTGKKFLFFSEKPKNHWYPGAGMGLAFD